MKNHNYSHNNHCKCGKLISNNAKYCKSCALKLNMKLRNYIGINNPNYKQGLPKCKDCGKELSNYYNKRCQSCEMKRKWKYQLIKHLRGKQHPLYKSSGSIVITAAGYINIKIEGIWKQLHRYKVEKYIGYKLKKNWVIHHIDGNPSNNKLSNLYIFIKRGLHLNFEICVYNKIINRNVIKSNLNKFKL